MFAQNQENHEIFLQFQLSEAGYCHVISFSYSDSSFDGGNSEYQIKNSCLSLPVCPRDRGIEYYNATRRSKGQR